MALAIGNKTQFVQTPSFPWTSLTRAHNMNTGADGFLFVSFTMTNTTNFSGCTYGGQAMTLIKWIVTKMGLLWFTKSTYRE
jgi:hypothetical protein